MPNNRLPDGDLVDLLRAECDRVSWPWFSSGEYDLNYFGIRSATDESDLFDDLLGCGFYLGGKPVVYLWAATTDPGRPSLQRPLRPEGCAILCDGYHPGIWKIGTHHSGQPGAYVALVQAAGAPYWRDADRDAQLDRTGPIYRDIIGINQHHAGVDSPVVGAWSAACQVHKRTSTFATSMDLARKQRDLRGWATYGYKLFDIRKSPSLVPVLGAIP